MRRLIITIDGPAGAGKTTVSRMLADRLGYRYIDTGALYRAVASAAGIREVGIDDDKALESLCRNLELELVPVESGLRILANKIDITDRLRSPEITMAASALSARPMVREYLLHVQRDLGKEKNIVIEGRDMGTVVFPDADVKFYLDASPETRAFRRYGELKGHSHQDLDSVKKDMMRRDSDDSTRKLAPLKAALDAVIIDSTHLPVVGVVDRMHAIVEKAGHPQT